MSERLLVKVAVFDIFRRDGLILFLLRQNTGYSDGLWSFPAGHVEKGEFPSEAAIREGQEETDTEKIEVTPVHVMYRKKLGEHTPYMDIFCVVNNFLGEPCIPKAEKNKCADMRWFPEANLPKNIVPGLIMALKYIAESIPYSEITETPPPTLASEG